MPNIMLTDSQLRALADCFEHSRVRNTADGDLTGAIRAIKAAYGAASATGAYGEAARGRRLARLYTPPADAV